MERTELNLNRLSKNEQEILAGFLDGTGYQEVAVLIQGKVPLGLTAAARAYGTSVDINRTIESIKEDGFVSQSDLEKGFLEKAHLKEADAVFVLINGVIGICEIKETLREKETIDVYRALGQCVAYKTLMAEDYPFMEEDNILPFIVCNEWERDVELERSIFERHAINVFEVHSERRII